VAVVLDLSIRRRGLRGGGFLETDVGVGRHRPIVAPVRGLPGLHGIERTAVGVLVIDRRAGVLRRRRRHHGDDRLAGRLTLRPAGDEPASRRRDQRGDGGAGEDGAGNFCAVMTNLLSTVPVSPWTLAPSESCQWPAMLRFALKRYVPGSAPGIGAILVAISCMPSGPMSRRTA